MTRLRFYAARIAVMAGLLIAGIGVSAALADPGNGNGPPPSPPGQGECQHGNSGQECKPDPQPGHGQECDEHGNQGGVNEDHCLGTTPTTTTDETTTDQTTTEQTTTEQTTTSETKTEQTTTQETTTTPSTTTSPSPGTATTAPSTGTFTPPAGPASGPHSTSAPPVTKPKLEKELAKQTQEVAAASVSREATPGELPFTGLPTWIVAMIGSLMLAAGLWIRRLAS